jgi:hypothetical protein
MLPLRSRLVAVVLLVLFAGAARAQRTPWIEGRVGMGGGNVGCADCGKANFLHSRLGAAVFVSPRLALGATGIWATESSSRTNKGHYSEYAAFAELSGVTDRRPRARLGLGKASSRPIYYQHGSGLIAQVGGSLDFVERRGFAATLSGEYSRAFTGTFESDATPVTAAASESFSFSQVRIGIGVRFGDKERRP